MQPHVVTQTGWQEYCLFFTIIKTCKFLSTQWKLSFSVCIVVHSAHMGFVWDNKFVFVSSHGKIVSDKGRTSATVWQLQAKGGCRCGISLFWREVFSRLIALPSQEENERQIESNHAGTSLGCPRCVIRTQESCEGRGEGKSLLQDKKQGQRRPSRAGVWKRGGLVNSPPCLSFVTDAEAQPLTTCKDGGGGGGCRGGRTCWINIFSPLLPPDSPSKWKPWLIYNMDSSDSWVYILCLYTRINVPSLAKRSWCFYLQTNILRPCYMFPRLLECVDNVVW